MKNSIRQYKIEKRQGLEKQRHSIKSWHICRRVIRSKDYADANAVMAYMPHKGEVDIHHLIKHILRTKKLILPKTNIQQNQIEARLVASYDDLERGAYGIWEPKEHCEKASACAIELMLVPLVAFDRQGVRLGYGGGYYDRFLKECKKAVTMGVGFSFQEHCCLPMEEHDMKLKIIVTEKEVIRPRRIKHESGI